MRDRSVTTWPPYRSTPALVRTVTIWAAGTAIVFAFAQFLLLVGSPATFREGGPVETFSVAVYLAAAAILLLAAARGARWEPRGAVAARLLGAGMILAFAARELDAHKALFSGSMTRSAFYVDASVPLVERLAAAALVAGVLAAALALAARAVRRRLADPSTPFVLAAVGWLATAKLVDGAPRKLGDLGITVGEGMGASFLAIEETLEVAAPLALLAAAIVSLRAAAAYRKGGPTGSPTRSARSSRSRRG